MCKALPGLHAFTGCDTVSAFAGKGKIRALTMLTANADFKEAFAQLGVQWNLTQNLHVNLEEFVCKLYATKPATSSIDALRYNLCCARKGQTKVMQNHISYLYVKAASESIQSVPTIKLQSGEGVL